MSITKVVQTAALFGCLLVGIVCLVEVVKPHSVAVEQRIIECRRWLTTPIWELDCSPGTMRYVEDEDDR